MKKKLLAALLSTAMVASMLAGCGNSGAPADSGSTPAADSGAAADNSGDAADSSGDQAAAPSGEVVKLKALACLHSLTQDVDDMEYVAEMEAEAGVDIEWELIRADWDTVKSTRFASGDIPDILISATTNADYMMYDGLFLNMADYINEDLTPNIVQLFNEEPDCKALVTQMDGRIFCVPKFQGKWPNTNTVVFINQEWLNNLNLEMPTTFSELKEVLIAFKENDANGNGDPNDEIPLDFNGWHGSAYSLLNWLGALGIQMTNWAHDAYFAEDSTVKCYAVDERYKLFMKYVADLYANGVINTNAVTNDYSMFQSLSRGNEAGDALVGVVAGWEETDKFGPTLHSQYVPLPALEYDIDCEPGTYDVRWRDDYTGLNISSDRAVVSAKCANPEAAMRFLDRFYDQTHSVEALFGGITDGNLEKTGDNSYKVLPPQDPDTDPGTWKWTSTFADNAPMYIRRSSEVEMSIDMTYALEERKVYDEILAKADKTDTYPQMFMKYSQEDQNTMALAQANINNIINNQWSLWMTGEADIDSTWDSYVQSVKDAGLDQVLEIRQKAFDEYLANN